jgi:hypothetical protein
VEKARQRRRLIRSLAGGGLALALVCAAALYEFRARDTYAMVRSPIRDAQENKNLREVLRLYDSVLDRYRYSLITRELRPYREDEEGRFMKEVTDRAADLEKKGQLPEAIAELEGADPLIRLEAHRGTIIDQRAKLRSKRVEKEREWTEKLKNKDPKEIGVETNPLAVPALVGLLGHEKPLMRLAAVTALGGIESETSVTGLIRALADPEPSITQAAAAHLVEKKRTPLQATLIGPRDSVKPGEELSVEWRLTNLSPAEVELALEEPPAQRLKMTGPNGTVPYTLPGGGRRIVRLGPGEFVGGTFPKITLAMAVAGRYTLNWASPVSWNGRSVVLAAPQLFIDRR